MRVARLVTFGLAACGGYLAMYGAVLTWLGDEVRRTNGVYDGPNGARATVVSRDRDNVLSSPTDALMLTRGGPAGSPGPDGGVVPHLPWGHFRIHDVVWTGERSLRVTVWSFGAGCMRGGTTITYRDGTQITLVE